MKDTKKERFVMLPSQLIYILSDKALRILLYAIERQGLVNIGALKDWKLNITNIKEVMSATNGYYTKSIRNGFRELKEMGLITLSKCNRYYTLNTEKLDEYMTKQIPLESTGLPKMASPALAKMGSPSPTQNGQPREESTIKENNIKEAVPSRAKDSEINSFNNSKQFKWVEELKQEILYDNNAKDKSFLSLGLDYNKAR